MAGVRLTASWSAVIVLWTLAIWLSDHETLAIVTDSVQVTNSLQKKVLHNTLRALLNFKQSPSYVVNGTKRTSRSTMAASKYMRRLFAQHMLSGDPSSSASIVRSISPVSAYLGDQNVMVFNLSAIQTEEEVMRAEIHCHVGVKKKRMGWNVKCYHLFSPAGIRKDLAMINFDNSNGWITFDVRSAVSAAMQNSSSQYATNNPTKLISVFCTSSPQLVGRYSPRRLKLSPHDNAFLIVRSQASNEQRLESAAVMNQSSDGLPGRRQKRNDNYFRYFYEASPTENASTTSFLTNTLLRQMKSFQEMGPAVLHPYRYKRKRDSKKRTQTTYMSDKVLDRNDFPPFGVTSKASKAAKELTSTSEATSAVHQETLVLLPSNGFGDNEHVCQKFHIVVDFRDIGWGEWIIAPTTFETNYCAGSCSFPIKNATNPSNHAIIQSIIHVIGLQPNVPQVCCAPNKMDSLTLLYFDEDQNVVLKSYPKMVVTSCGCL
ncbi:unnamed protein product [Soboliphyme baturini]|uniref:TGF_BETA_2 domain-containing protein n=1 Tax=Soboliphyme baturini TaxID=241478 RepID=A0A183IJF8_9BILA|nr:unnamed protein product [Soboliphyme baturini]